MTTTQETATPAFFSTEWAQAARAAMEAGPDAELKAVKLDTYWDWIDKVRAAYASSWAIADADRPAALGGPGYLLVQWADGHCVRAEVVDEAAADGADYLLVAKHAVWRDLLTGADAGRLLMTRQVELRRGNVLQFYRGVYFVVEALAAIGRVPAQIG